MYFYFRKPPSTNSSLISCFVIKFCFVSTRIEGIEEVLLVEFTGAIFRSDPC